MTEGGGAPYRRIGGLAQPDVLIEAVALGSEGMNAGRRRRAGRVRAGPTSDQRAHDRGRRCTVPPRTMQPNEFPVVMDHIREHAEAMAI